MDSWIIPVMNQHGYWVISLLIALENIFPPIPSEIILTFAGYMTTNSAINIWIVTLFATIGSVIGSCIIYGVGRIFRMDRIEKWLDSPIGRVLRIKPQDVKKAKKWFAKRGKLTVFFCRFIPIVRSLISIPAGMSNMHFGIFLTLTTCGTAIWNAILIFLGALAGKSYQKIIDYMSIYSKVIMIAFMIIFIILVFIWIKKQFMKKNYE